MGARGCKCLDREVASADERGYAALPDDSKRRWAPLCGADGLDFAESAGKVGLKNLGNSCFMNAGLQCLSHLEPFVAFFLTGKYREELKCADAESTGGGGLASAFAQLQVELWQKQQLCFSPRAFRAEFARRAPYLTEGSRQQDVQEFLAICLDGLHEDLNLALPLQRAKEDTEQREPEEVNDEGYMGSREEIAAALSWIRHLELGKSFLVDLLQGQLRSSLTCACGERSRRFDAFLYLSVPIGRGMTRITDAVERFLEEEMLEGDERWYCPRCKEKVDARKKFDLWKLPPVLVLHLKRFEFDVSTQRFGKVSAPLSAPLTLDLSPYVSSPQREHATYDIVAVADHLGQFGSGHYTATCRLATTKGNTWLRFSDDQVTPVLPEEVVGRNAYVIFLVRRAGDKQIIKRQTVSLPEVWPHWVSVRESNASCVEQFRGDLLGLKAGAVHVDVQSARESGGGTEPPEAGAAHIDVHAPREDGEGTDRSVDVPS